MGALAARGGEADVGSADAGRAERVVDVPAWSHSASASWQRRRGRLCLWSGRRSSRWGTAAYCEPRGARHPCTPWPRVSSSGRSTSKKCVRRQIATGVRRDVSRVRGARQARVRWACAVILVAWAVSTYLFAGRKRSALQNSVSDGRRDKCFTSAATARHRVGISKIATIADRINTFRRGSAHAARLLRTTAARRRSQHEGHSSSDLPRNQKGKSALTSLRKWTPYETPDYLMVSQDCR